MSIASFLDEHQLAAATAPDGPALVRAGAGTGKTRVLTTRVAWLIEQEKCRPEEIMAVTFTNKAAREIRERVSEAVGPEQASQIRLGTFHSLSCRILRRMPSLAGLSATRRFSILDPEDARGLVLEIIRDSNFLGEFIEPAREEGEEEERWQKRVKLAERQWVRQMEDFATRALNQMARWKGWGLSAEMAESYDEVDIPDSEKELAAFYGIFQEELARRNLCDFGDLILHVVEIFRKHPEIAERESRRVRYLLVDEAQDANPAQVQWVRTLSHYHGNLMVIGDEDQNIFAFQGGYQGVMEDMAGVTARHYDLVRNRRCTEEILAPANRAVALNPRRQPKVLHSGVHGDPVSFTAYENESKESLEIARKVKALIEEGVPPSQIACLVRSRYTMTPLEEAFSKLRVPHEIVGGFPLLEREEVKDILAYLSLAVDPALETAFRRIVNKPVRGLGPVAADMIVNLTLTRTIGFSDACYEAAQSASLNDAARVAVADLAHLLSVLVSGFEKGRNPKWMINFLLKNGQYEAWLRKSKNKPEARIRNVEFLASLAGDYSNLVDFLDEVALMTDVELHDEESERVRVSTIHGAKGLEFDHVFCPAFDAAVIPSPRAVMEGVTGDPRDPWRGPLGGGIEEERRLAHVAFTRARKTLEISFPALRTDSKSKLFGPSSFVTEFDLCGEDVLKEAAEAAKAQKRKGRRKGFTRRR